jgi:sugar lactone lactonase YvrE
MTAVTPRSITDRRRLQAELRLTATRGWSVDDEEIVPGVRCCGAPIVDADGLVRGAISVAGPAFRLTMDRLQLIGPEVADAARRIGAQLSSTRVPRSEGRSRVVAGDWAFNGAFVRWTNARLYWVDTLAPAVHVLDVGSDRVLARPQHPVDAAVPLARGLALLCGDSWWRVAADGGLQPLPAWPRRRATAVTVAPDGRLTACVSDGDRWRVAPLAADGGLAGGWRLAEPAHALAWNAAGDTLVIAAADSGTLYLAQPGSSSLRRLATVPKGSGRLSGLALDRDGGVWCALRGGWSVVRFQADGTLDHVVALPVPCPSDLGFGGADGRTLYVSSARDAVSRESLDAAPLSGRLFAVDAGVAGVLTSNVTAHGLRQARRLVAHAGGGGRALFHQRGVLLRHVVELRDGAVDLADAGGLFLRGGAISPMTSLTRRTLATISLHGAAGVAHQAGAAVPPVDAAADEGLDLARGLGRPLGQAAHLAGHHGEAAALFAGARGFHRGVQRQDVGLEGDAVDGADDVADLAAAGVDLVHRGHHLATPPRRRAAAAPAAAGQLVAPGGALGGAACVPVSSPSRRRSAAGCWPAPRCGPTGRACRWRSRPRRSRWPARRRARRRWWPAAAAAWSPARPGRG